MSQHPDTQPHRTALLVYPEFPVYSYWNFRLAHEQLFPRNEHGYPKGVIPPLGLLCIAGPIAARYGRDNVRLIDMNVQPLTDADLAWADDVYLSAMLTQSDSFDDVAARAKAAGKTTIGGGPYVDPHTPNLDHIFINESEYTLEPFLDELFGGEPQRVHHGVRPKSGDFLEPDYSWLDINHYASMGLQFSRGCPHDCEFCDITIRYGRAMRTKEVDTFIDELQRLYELGWRGSVFIIDDNFIGKPRDALALLQALAIWQRERNYPFELYTQATVLLAEQNNRELLQAFYPAGFSMIFLGIETPNEESLRETGKKSNLAKGMTLAEKINTIKREGKILVLGGFIVGFDNDKPDIFARQERFINEEAKIPMSMVGILEPLPQTKLALRLTDEGRVIRKSLGTVAGAHNVAFTPKYLTEDELRDGYIDLIERLYLDTSKFYARCTDSIRHVGKPLFQGIFTYDILYGTAKLLWVEGVTSKHRGAFWKFLGTTLLRYPSKLPYAMRWGGYGLHYRILTEHLLAREAQRVAGLASATHRKAPRAAQLKSAAPVG